MAHEPDKYYLTLGVKAFKAIEGISDSAKPYFVVKSYLDVRQRTIKAYGQEIRSWLIIMDLLPGIRFESKNLPAWATFLSTL